MKEKAPIIGLLFVAKVLGRIVGLAARTQTRLLTWAQSLGWKPSEHELMKLMRRQHQLFQFQMTKKQYKAMKRMEREQKWLTKKLSQ